MSRHWAKAEVELLASKFIVNGRTATEFHPDGEISRGEFIAILTRALGLNENRSKAAGFKDISTEDWYAGTIGAAVEAGLVQGFEDGSFRPKLGITREQMFVMLDHAVKLIKAQIPADKNDLLPYADVDSISAWAAESVARLHGAGLVQGMEDDRLAPQSAASRAQAVVLLKRLLLYVGWIHESTSMR